MCQAAAEMNWTKPSKIQKEALPIAFEGIDMTSQGDNYNRNVIQVKM